MLIDLPALNARLSAAGSVAANKVVWFDRIGSTMDYLMQSKDIHGHICLAGIQESGRGRRGKQWLAPYGSSVLMSTGWQVEESETSGMSLVCGLAVQSALGNLGVDNVSLKWPNDVLLSGRKVAGILVEIVDRKCVIGLGLNVDVGSAETQSPVETMTPWTDLMKSGYAIEYQSLVYNLIISLGQYLEDFNRMGFSPFINQWNQHHSYHGKMVRVSGTENSTGVVSGVNENGGLVLNTDIGQKVFYSGNVSMLPLDPLST